jgi:glycosyltransferase involved in cell wall biosynthesis
MNISILIPCYNESKKILELIQLLHNLNISLSRESISLNFLLVDNGCSDDTFRKLDIEKPDHVACCLIQTLQVTENIGYGFGVKSALEATHGKTVCILPADGKYDFTEISYLISTYVGTRSQDVLLKGVRHNRNDPKVIRILSFFYTKLVNVLTGIKVKDVNGLPKIFLNNFTSRDIQLMSNTACLDATLLSLWARKGGRFKELPLNFTQNLEGETSWSGKRTVTTLKMFQELVRSTLRIRIAL